jgi:mannose-1-phosphate guanylyltransferase/mannose-6-phosphate isomerase
MKPRIQPVILCGGAGSRLWPLSRKLLPKQFLPLVGKQTMLQETALRMKGAEGVGAPVIVSNAEHRFLVAEQLREIDAAPAALILEPEARNTAPALAAAAFLLAAGDPDAVMLVLPADHLIADVRALRAAAVQSAALAAKGLLTTFGIVPKEPATGYGYIERGAPIDGVANAYRVARFVEKPDRAKAEGFLAHGGFYWNSGMFAFPARVFLDELARHAPAVHRAAREAWEKSTRDLDFIRLDGNAFARAESISVDYAVMERTDRAAVLPVELGWSDVGSWATLWQLGQKDAAGNVTRGDVSLHGAENCYVRAEKRFVAVVGARNLVVVETDDAVLVADQAQAQDVKSVVEQLHNSARGEHISHRRVYRPWGYYESIDDGERFQVKRIMVKPGHALSLQMHHHRAEHWVVVSGTARVRRGEEEVLLSENESTYIPIGAKHRLENPGKVPLYLIEVQSGGYLGEDDIVRFEDKYGR